MTKQKPNIVHSSATFNYPVLPTLNKKRYILLFFEKEKRYILLVTQKYIWNTKNCLITNILSILNSGNSQYP